MFGTHPIFKRKMYLKAEKIKKKKSHTIKHIIGSIKMSDL